MKCLLLILLSALTFIIINPIHHHAASSFMIIISPPSSAQDYRQLASLLVASFDAPLLQQISGSSSDDGGDEKVDGSNYYNDKLSKQLLQLKWNLYEKSLTEEFTYKRYVSTVRRMRGKKYCLLVAKKIFDESEVEYGVVDSSFGEENEIPSPNYNNGEVVGLVEMGMSLCPSPTINTTSTSSSENYSSNSNNNNTTKTKCITPTPLIGVICVSPTHQKEGIAMKLIHRCEEIARDLWQEDFICADVEPTNTRALSLFEKGGYDACLDEDRDVLMRDATILRRRRVEVKPHYLMRKRIRDDDDYDKGNNEVDEAFVNNVSAES